MDMIVEKVSKARGTLKVPGDKSIAHRALIFGALAEGMQWVSGLPRSQDVSSTITCIRKLGCEMELKGDGEVMVRDGEWRTGQVLDAGNSGTTARILSGMLAGLSITCTLDGDDSLRKRPMERVALPLRAMGAKVATSENGCLPMVIEGGDLKGIDFEPEAASAQVKSAVLLAGLRAKGFTTVRERLQTRDHTEKLFQAMGVSVQKQGLSVTVQGGDLLNGIHVHVPGDISSALFFLAAAALLPGSEVRLPDTGVNPTRIGALEALQQMGADIAVDDLRKVNGEAVACLVGRPGPLRGMTVEKVAIPALIDELPLLAVVATQAEGTTLVQGASELRLKESDRIKATVENLASMGAVIEEFDDGFAVSGPTPLRGGRVFSHGDHRIAMAMGVAGLIAEGKTVIEGSEAAAVSYPGFFPDLLNLVS